MTVNEKAAMNVAINILEWYRDQALGVSMHLKRKRFVEALAVVEDISADSGNRAAAMIEVLEQQLEGAKCHN